MVRTSGFQPLERGSIPRTSLYKWPYDEISKHFGLKIQRRKASRCKSEWGYQFYNGNRWVTTYVVGKGLKFRVGQYPYIVEIKSLSRSEWTSLTNHLLRVSSFSPLPHWGQMASASPAWIEEWILYGQIFNRYVGLEVAII